MAKKGGNPQNLQNIADLSPEQRRERAAKGGKAKAENERKRKAMREQLEMLLQLPVKSKKGLNALKNSGVTEPELQDNQAAMMAVALSKALNGNIEFMEFVRDTIGEKPANTNNTTVDATVTSLSVADKELLKTVGDRLASDS